MLPPCNTDLKALLHTYIYRKAAEMRGNDMETGSAETCGQTVTEQIQLETERTKETGLDPEKRVQLLKI